MFFQSYGFIFLFLPLVLLGWWQLNRFFLRQSRSYLFLILASLFFYGFMNVSFLPVLLGSVLLNFAAGRLLTDGKHRRLVLVLALLANLGALGYFKYTNFFLENLNALLGSSYGALSILLPLGISFFTFQQIAYLVDAYRGEAPRYGFLEYAAFATFFPCVASGPIAFHHEVIPQLRAAARRHFCAEGFSQGVFSFSVGLGKKVLLADTFGAAANWGFGSIEGLNSTTAILVVLSYAFQLYFDFSGYTDMARGVGLMLGVRLPSNFNAPYKALTIGGFWKGWHMTMTRFFTRYLYIPLGGSHRGEARTCLNILIVFLVSGLWHGASWTFVVWGALHGLAMVVDRLWGKHAEKLHPVLSWGLTFAFVNFCWVFFRAVSLTQAVQMCKAVLRCDFGAVAAPFTHFFCFPEFSWFGNLLGLDIGRLCLFLCLAFLLLAFVLCLQGKTVEETLAKGRLDVRSALFCAVLVFWSLISLTGVTTFLYSNF